MIRWKTDRISSMMGRSVVCGQRGADGTRSVPATFAWGENCVVKTVVVIGASNVTLSLPLIWSSVRQSVAGPCRVLVAAAHGRSFGTPSTVFGRTLPGIQECGLWQALEDAIHSEDSDAEVLALVTDVGNDILYGAHPAQISDWVTDAVENLIGVRATIALSELPLQSLRRLSRHRFLFFRRMLFPRSQLTYEDAQEYAEILNGRLLDLIRHHELIRLRPETRWYGLDPIHVRRKFRREAWPMFLSPLISGLEANPAGIGESLRVWRRKPATSWRGKKRRTTEQPVLKDKESELWLF